MPATAPGPTPFQHAVTQTVGQFRRARGVERFAVLVLTPFLLLFYALTCSPAPARSELDGSVHVEVHRAGVRIVAIDTLREVVRVTFDGPAATVTRIDADGVRVDTRNEPWTLSVDDAVLPAMLDWQQDHTELTIHGSTTWTGGKMHPGGLTVTAPDGRGVTADPQRGRSSGATDRT